MANSNQFIQELVSAFNQFFESYLSRTGDKELLKAVAPFYAFRGVVVANPFFYPEVTDDQRGMIFRFINTKPVPVLTLNLVPCLPRRLVPSKF